MDGRMKMKLITILTFALLRFLYIGPANATLIFSPSIVQVGYHTGYLPDGFDTNDNVQVIGEGLFSNSCYRPGPVQVNVDQTAKTITLTPKAYFYDGMC